MNLRTRAAGAGVAHRPEVVLRAHVNDALAREPGDLLPQAFRFRVRAELALAAKHGDHEPLFGNVEHLGQHVPRVDDRFFLEVVAEGEVAEHLEERVMPRRDADVLQVVVLAADANALLRRGRALVRPRLLAGEHIFELDHARVGEHQGRVIARHNRPRRQQLVSLLLKVPSKRVTNSFGRAHVAAEIPRRKPPRKSFGNPTKKTGLPLAKARASTTRRPNGGDRYQPRSWATNGDAIARTSVNRSRMLSGGMPGGTISSTVSDNPPKRCSITFARSGYVA